MKTQLPKPMNNKVLSFMLAILFFGSLFQSARAQDNNYLIGVGIHDITGQIAEANFFGYANPFHRNTGIRDRQYARAFIVQEPSGNPVVFVVIDKGGTFQSVNQAVMAKLASTYGDLYNDTNVIISATHTHVAAGGFSHYQLYCLAAGGYWKTNFDNMVEGIYNAIVRAHEHLALGSIYYNRGSLTNASINRSLVAYENNRDAGEYPSIDEEMTVLKFLQGDTEVGMISWFGVHPTSLSNTYRHNSADNKGYAALKFERLKNSSYGESGSFVAAFANTNAGDMSPNLNMPPADKPYQEATGPGKNEEESANIIGNRQYEAALGLYQSATVQLKGSIEVVSRYSDFSNITIAPKFTDGEPRCTCKAALGLSFIAGAEDGRSGIGREGVTKDPDFGLPIDRCHAEKVIAPFFFLGLDDNNPRTPKILPTTLMKIGQLGILAAPAEFTIMAGRRARAAVESIDGTGITNTVFSGYSDAYAGYVTTREEYASQQYEGGSTHFGPWTAAAYQQEFERLALKMANPASDPWPVAEPTAPVKKAPLDANVNILFDSTPLHKQFGDVEKDVKNSYERGERAEITFWGGHPNNDLKTNSTYLMVEWWDGSAWKPFYLDRDPVTKLTWKRKYISSSLITISWDIPQDAPAGNYRIRHFGKWKAAFSGKLSDYTGTSSSFFVKGGDKPDITGTRVSISDKEGDEIKFSKQFKIYPNPTSYDRVVLTVKDDFMGSYEVFSPQGQRISQGEIKGKGSLNLKLSPTKGIYFLKLRDKNGQTYQYKVFKK